MSKPRSEKPRNREVISPRETIVVNSANNSTAALAALYQGEKTDVSSILNTAMAMMGVALAYMVGAVSFVGKLSDGSTPWPLLLLLPFPLWLAIAYHSLIALNAMSHVASVRIIEDALFETSGLPSDKRLRVGSAAGDKIMDIRHAKIAHKLTTALVYGGVGILVILFTCFALHSANGIVKRNITLAQVPVMTISIVAYSLVLVLVAASWIEGFRVINGPKGNDSMN
jgi:hypothetical protein